MTAGVNGFCNDITVDDDGNVYATDSWYPRILRLPAGATSADDLEEWVTSDVFPRRPVAPERHRHRSRRRQHLRRRKPSGALYSIPIMPDGSAGTVTEVETSRPLYSPDGLKVIGPNLLAIAEGQTGGMSMIELGGNTGIVRRVSTGLDGIATFALRDGSAWLVENQGDHFWGKRPIP